MSAVRVLIADDHHALQEGVRAIIEQQQGWKVCGTAATWPRSGRPNLSTIFDRLVVTELATATLARYQIVTYTGSLTGVFNTLTLPSGYSIDTRYRMRSVSSRLLPSRVRGLQLYELPAQSAWSQRRRFARSFSTFWVSVSRIPSGQLSIPR